MNKESLIIEANKILKQRNVLLVLSTVMLVANIFLSVTLFLHDKEIVLVPNFLDEKTSIKNNKMSPAYLEAITRDAINLMLNVSPANAEYITKSILKITHPAFYGKLKKDLNERAKDIINRRISTLFYPQSMLINEGHDGVIIVGKLSTYLGKEEVLTEDKTYSIAYSFDGFRPLILDFYEVDKNLKTKGGDDD